MVLMVANLIHWTVQDLEGVPNDWGSKCSEIISGELTVTGAPHGWHQGDADRLSTQLENRSRKTKAGRSFQTPGVVFTEADVVIPNVVWASNKWLVSSVAIKHSLFSLRRPQRILFRKGMTISSDSTFLGSTILPRIARGYGAVKLFKR